MVLEMEMSKTYQYRKVMKPMLERKRRARINKCLDELKDIMVECLTQEGEHITRLEKADILELTVEHMKKLKQQKQLRLQNAHINPEQQKLSIIESFRAGYVHAANEVSKVLASIPGVSVELGTQMMSHLGHRLNYLQVVIPSATPPPSAAVTTTVTSATTGLFSSPSILCPSPSSSSSSVPNSSPIMSSTQNYMTHNSYKNLSYFDDRSSHNCGNVIPTTQMIITPPPSECSNSSDRGSSCDSPTPSESSSVWRPW